MTALSLHRWVTNICSRLLLRMHTPCSCSGSPDPSFFVLADAIVFVNSHCHNFFSSIFQSINTQNGHAHSFSLRRSHALQKINKLLTWLQTLTE
uniref:Secreted protein n=1 Tax=Globodera pallida TaxID=36090 RepID=A0A183CIM4_GLOPA